jgi:hypothetical protein
MQIPVKFTTFISDVLNMVKTITVSTADQDIQNNNLIEEYSLLSCSAM